MTCTCGSWDPVDSEAPVFDGVLGSAPSEHDAIRSIAITVTLSFETTDPRRLIAVLLSAP
jgi:hypothetical protein